MHDIVRWNERALEKALKTRRVIVISGARQCGKSTLLEMYFKGKSEVRSLDSKQFRDAALLDPQSFIRNDTDCPMVIDEIQKAPDLLSEIKLVVDKNRAPGQYVVTGSSDIYSAPESKESLAGRVKNIRMRTFTQGELRGGKSVDGCTAAELKFASLDPADFANYYRPKLRSPLVDYGATVEAFGPDATDLAGKPRVVRQIDVGCYEYQPKIGLMLLLRIITMTRIITAAALVSGLWSLTAGAAVDALEPLPLGSITARGWLREQLVRNRDGMGGHLDELEPQMIATPYTTRETYKGWGDCTPGWGAEISGNYWGGLVQLAWTLDDAGLKAKAAKWVGEVLQNVETNGYVGTYPPGSNRMEDYNASGNACGYLALLDFYEATGRKDVLDAVHNALIWFCREWAGDRKTRYSGVTLSVPMLACARLTGDRRLVEFCLDYQRFLEKKDLFRTSVRAFGSGDFEYNSNHAVAYVNHMAIPAMLFSATGERTCLDASIAAVDKLRRMACHVTGAPSGNDEYLSAPRVNGESEYCGFAGLVEGYSRILAASGDTRFGDWMEETAFNAAQGARKKDEKAIQYFSSPNMVYATVKSSHTHMDDNLFGPVHPVACCAVRAVQVLPNFTRSLAMRDRAGNLHLTAYAPCAIRHRGVELVSETAYPFRDTVAYAVTAEKPVRFAIVPKKPCWCPKMTLRVNGEEVASADREWRTGDRLELKFEMPVRVERFNDRAGTEPLVVRRGPLVFSLPIGENWKNLGNGVTGGGTRNCAAATPLPEGWAWWSVEPVVEQKKVPMYEYQGYVRELISWNVALDETRIDVRVEETEPKGYVWENPPVRLHLTGYKAPFAFPPYPAKTTEFYQALQTATRPIPVTLVPFGCTALRITYFPRCDAARLRPDLSFELP